jgi:hypothetical protein
MKVESLPGCARLDSRGRLSLRELFRLVSTLSQMASVSRAILREIFDESAYQRFLDRSCLQSSPNAYAVFQEENEHAKSRRPRCC